jgi:hypothetical protein
VRQDRAGLPMDLPEDVPEDLPEDLPEGPVGGTYFGP